MAPKKEARPKGPGNTLLVAAQYIQKTRKNNGLLAIWLTDFRPIWPRFSRRKRPGPWITGGIGTIPAHPAPSSRRRKQPGASSRVPGLLPLHAMAGLHF
jgi:hypothetical protein